MEAFSSWKFFTSILVVRFSNCSTQFIKFALWKSKKSDELSINHPLPFPPIMVPDGHQLSPSDVREGEPTSAHPADSAEAFCDLHVL
jgi:hypothetical protein